MPKVFTRKAKKAKEVPTPMPDQPPSWRTAKSKSASLFF